MNIALFGGTFDPIHRGHLAVARAAQQRFDLKQVHFVPAHVPPHKQRQPITSYYDRYAMVALATAAEKSFLPSPIESPEVAEGPSYSVQTVRRFRRGLKKSDRLFFLIGIDAFMEIATWRDPELLLRECEFIVAARPGFSLADVARALPDELRPPQAVTRPFEKQPARGDIVLGEIAIHLLEEVHERVSATQVRAAAAKGRPLGNMVEPTVAEYIRKTQLYKPGKGAARAARSPALPLVSGRAAHAGHSEDE